MTGTSSRGGSREARGRTPAEPESKVGVADATDQAEPDPRQRRSRRGIWILGVVVGVVVLAGVATLVGLSTRDSGQPVSMDEARRRAGAAGYGTDQTEAPPPFRPAAGIYQYRGEGTEHLDKPPVSQTQGPDIPGTVTHLEGDCWRLRVDYSTNHWQSWDYCSIETGLTERAGSFYQRLDLVAFDVETTSTSTCDPPVDAITAAPQVGDQWTQECRGTSTGTSGEVISTGPYTYVGPEDLDIGGTRVQALHYHRFRTLTGGQSGTEDIHVWFHADTGLPLRNERTIEVRSDSLIGGVTYDEKGSFQLTSMSPTR